MTEVSGTRQPLLTALTAFKSDMATMTSRAATSAAGVLALYKVNDVIPRRNQDTVLEQVGRIIEGLYIVPGTRRVFDNNNLGLAPYAQALNLRLGEATWGVILAHQRFLQKTLPDDLWAWLSTTGQPYKRVVAEQGEGERRKLLDTYQIFRPNPLAQYEPAHTWVDPKGYRLSDRIWRNAVTARMKIDELLTTGIQQGWSANRLAKAVVQYTRPDGKASYEAMRLARSEITRAHGQASLVAGRTNPYVTHMRYATSGKHKLPDICDELAAGSPYLISDYVPLPVQDSHPQCMCVVSSMVTSSPAQVTAGLHEAMQIAREEHVDPFITTVQARQFLFGLLGDELGMTVLRQSLAMVGL